MAIFPIHNKHTVNIPVSISADFKAGSALMYDNNGRAVLANRASTAFDNLIDQQGKFIGFSSNDHSSTSTIINPDPVGSNYNINSTFYDNANGPYTSAKRSIMDYRDENVNNYYNITSNNPEAPRGSGVYNLQGEIYITDQFTTKLADTFWADSTTDITYIPGDLLTFGAGINAGKLVKVDTSGFGPAVLVIGTVEKYDSASNLLYFRHVLETYKSTSTSIVTSGAILLLDASDPVSYPGTGSTWFDTSGNGLNAQLLNGPVWSSQFGGVFVLDGTDDFIEITHNALMNLPGDFTIEAYYYPIELSLHGIISKRNPFGGGVGVWTIGSFFSGSTYQNWFWNPVADPTSVYINSNSLVQNFNWYSFAVTRLNGTKSFWLNGAYDGGAYDPTDLSNTYNLRLASWHNGSNTASYYAAVRIYNRALNEAELKRNVNSTLTRLLI
jgi:hypothetical protein